MDLELKTKLRSLHYKQKVKVPHYGNHLFSKSKSLKRRRGGAPVWWLVERNFLNS